MGTGGYLRADVDGDVFWLDERILSSLCSNMHKGTSSETTTSQTQNLQFLDLPGGAEVFELVVRFCYNQEGIEITSTNACLLVFAAHFMEMTDETSSPGKLAKQAEKFLDGMPTWSCSEILAALRQCRNNLPIARSSGVFEKVMDGLMSRVGSDCSMSPSSSSPESYGFRFSFDTRSTASTKTSSNNNTSSSLPKAWWLDDLVAFNGGDVLQMIVKSMLAHELDHNLVARFLLYYVKAKSSNASLDKKTEMMEIVIKLVYTLDRSSVSCKSLFEMLRLSSFLNLNQASRSKVEKMIGQQLHQATLDNLLVPAQVGTRGTYDVGLVLRLLKYFLDNGGRLSMSRLKKVGGLVDLYMAEVAPDPGLKPQTFSRLCTALPDRARDSYDAVHQAIDVYFQIHPELPEEEKMKICCAMNYEKITSETCKHLTQSPNFPSRTAVQALVSQQTKLKSLLQETSHIGTPLSRLRSPMNDEEQQIILYAKKFPESTENRQLKAQIQGMQWRVAELESTCKKMQAQISSIAKMGTSRSRPLRSLPKLCS